MKKIFLYFLLLFILGCKDNSVQEKELELKKKELELKEKELELRQDSINKSAANFNDKPTLTEPTPTIEKLIGYWFTPHAAMLNIQFNRDKTFILNNFDSEGREEKLNGTYELIGKRLTLYYSDRPKQSFRFYRGAGNDDNYYIENPGNYFVKGENGSK